MKGATIFFSLRRLLLSIRLINNWTLCRTIQRVIVLVNSNRCLVRFLNYSRNCSLKCTPLGPITIINCTRHLKSASGFALAYSRHLVSWGVGSAINDEQKIGENGGQEKAKERLWENLGRSDKLEPGTPSDWSVFTGLVNTRAFSDADEKCDIAKSLALGNTKNTNRRSYQPYFTIGICCQLKTTSQRSCYRPL